MDCTQKISFLKGGLGGEMSYRSGFIAIIGRPNVGKSTFLNFVLGQKVAIVSDKPQTTRNRIMGVHHLAEGQMIFFDTPGIHKAKGHLNTRMVQAAFASLREVDLILLFVEPPVEWTTQEHLILERLAGVSTPKILVINKIDRIHSNALIPLLDHHARNPLFQVIVPISAKTGDNVDRLLSIILPLLPEGDPLFPEETVTDQPIRFLAAEMIREHVFKKTRNEIPYAVAVKIETFTEEAAIIRIRATLFVERASQKGILIGAHGGTLKQIGQAAREAIEALLGARVFLEMWVKVRKEWREDPTFLKEVGYGGTQAPAA